MPWAERRRCRLHYELTGDEGLPVLVLIRGLARSKSYWGALLPLLQPHLRLLLLDNRGVGRSDATWGSYTTRQLADDVAAVMDAAQLERAHVFGISLGGMIAQELALAHGERIDRLVLGCTTPGGRRARRTPALAQLGIVAAAFGRTDPLYGMLLSETTRRAHPEIREHWLALTRTEPVPLRGLLGQAAAALRHDVSERLADITHPTLVLTGDEDVIVSPENSRVLAAVIPNATLTVLRGARHDFTTDRADDAARAIVGFLGATR